jgi:NADH-quinone oxidoreductase subunit H
MVLAVVASSSGRLDEPAADRRRPEHAGDLGSTGSACRSCSPVRRLHHLHDRHQAELTQAPFDMPIADQACVRLHDRVLRLPLPHLLHWRVRHRRCVRVHRRWLFLGGWGVPFSWFGWDTVDSVDNWMNLAGPVIMLTKMMVLTLIIMWVRFSYPRFREDQLQRFAWKVLIPLSLLNIVVTAVLKVAV